MTDRRNPRTLDEELAGYADGLLEGRPTADQTVQYANSHLASLLETVNLAARSVPPRTPEAALKNRIRANLSARWRKEGPGLQPERLTQSSGAILILRYGIVVAGVALVIGLLFPPVNTALPGAAQSPAVAFGIVAALLVVLVVLFFFLSKHKP